MRLDAMPGRTEQHTLFCPHLNGGLGAQNG